MYVDGRDTVVVVVERIYAVQVCLCGVCLCVCVVCIFMLLLAPQGVHTSYPIPYIALKDKIQSHQCWPPFNPPFQSPPSLSTPSSPPNPQKTTHLQHNQAVHTTMVQVCTSPCHYTPTTPGCSKPSMLCYHALVRGTGGGSGCLRSVYGGQSTHR